MMKQTPSFSAVTWAASALALALLAGCGSNVKLDEVPVSDRTGTAAGAAGVGTGGLGGGTPANARPVPTLGAQGQGVDMAEPPAAISRVIYFDFESFIVKPEFASVLEGHAQFLKQDAKRHVTLQGHTDERGGREYNLALGQKRAEAVRRTLTVLGVSDDQLEAVSFGKEKPAVLGSTEDAYAKNRRVELSYR
jgi:peptidoglycan-associated lipoprotein